MDPHGSGSGTLVCIVPDGGTAWNADYHHRPKCYQTSMTKCYNGYIVVTRQTLANQGYFKDILSIGAEWLTY